jgi:hypothetical protein
LFDKLLKEIGLKSETFEKMRLGPGVVGRSATVAVVALLVLGVVAWRLTDQNLLLVIAGASFILFLIYFIGAMIYGAKNPAAALLEGAELVTWQKQELAAKNVPHPPDSPLITDPRPPSIVEIESVK